MTGSAPLTGILLALGLSACSSPPAAQEAGARRAIEATVTRYVDASNRGDADALMEMYAEDALLLPPDHQPIEGRQAIGAFWRLGTDQGLEVTTIRLDTDGKIGYLVGRYRLPATDDEPADSGKYVMCLKRQADGAWKLTADIWNSSTDDETDDSPPTTEPRSVSRARVRRYDGATPAEVPSGAGRDVPRWSDRPA